MRTRAEQRDEPINPLKSAGFCPKAMAFQLTKINKKPITRLKNSLHLPFNLCWIPFLVLKYPTFFSGFGTLETVVINRWKPTAWLWGWKSCKWSLFFPSNIYLFLVALADSRFRVDTSYFKTTRTAAKKSSFTSTHIPHYGQYGIQHRTSSSTFQKFSLFSLLKFSLAREFIRNLAKISKCHEKWKIVKAMQIILRFDEFFLENKEKRFILGIYGSFPPSLTADE